MENISPFSEKNEEQIRPFFTKKYSTFELLGVCFLKECSWATINFDLQYFHNNYAFSYKMASQSYILAATFKL